MTAAAFADYDRKDFEKSVAKRREPAFLLNLRRRALAQFETLGLPTTKQEAWRFTDVSGLGQIDWQPSSAATVEASQLPALPGAHRLVFVNGHFAPTLSQLHGLPAKALVASLGQALLTHPELVESHLGQSKGLDNNPFAARNSTFWEDGAFVYLPRGTVLEQPLQLIFFATGDDTVNYPRTLVVMEEASEATILTEYRGQGRCLTCPVTEIHQAAGAVLNYYEVQEAPLEAWHLGNLQLLLAQDSQINTQLLSLGGLGSRTDVFALLDGEGATCQVSGLTLVKSTQLSDFHVRVEHAKPHGTSHQLFKSVLEDKGRSVFDGLIYVHKHAQQTNANQSNQNLLLSRQALANSNPRLEILADDVKCSHGSTIGFLDQDALFYLRSRGIGEVEAQNMLVYAFANDLVEQIHLKPLRERLENLLMERLS
jgi:Fe-S cluster assembly protein SufD